MTKEWQDRLAPQIEAQRILALVRQDELEAVKLMERQLFMIFNRAQVLASVAGAVITVTGFSGRLIAGTSRWGQWFLVTGLALVVFSAVYVFLKVMRVTWISTQLEEDFQTSLVALIRLRNRKTRAYTIGGLILVLGLLLYGLSVSIMLLNPEPMNLPVR